MKRTTSIMALLLSFALLAGCDPSATQAGDASPGTSPSEASASPGAEGGNTDTAVTCRIVDGAESGRLLLAALDEDRSDGVFSLDLCEMAVWMEGELVDSTVLKDGMKIVVTWNGSVMETFPVQLAGVSAIEVTEDKADDRCGLYLQVLEDLWAVDPGLNSGLAELGVDLSGLNDLSGAEKSAVAWRFGELHGLTPIQGSYAELCEQGYIDGDHLDWEDGCLFSIATDTEAVCSLPMWKAEEEPPVLTAFDAQKWRSGTGAYFFCDCVGQRAEDGAWTYTVGSEAIS